MYLPIGEVTGGQSLWRRPAGFLVLPDSIIDFLTFRKNVSIHKNIELNTNSLNVSRNLGLVEHNLKNQIFNIHLIQFLSVKVQEYIYQSLLEDGFVHVFFDSVSKK